MATHSSILAWRIPWTEEPGGLQSTGSQRVGHDWVTDTFTASTTNEPTLDSLIKCTSLVLPKRGSPTFILEVMPPPQRMPWLLSWPFWFFSMFCLFRLGCTGPSSLLGLFLWLLLVALRGLLTTLASLVARLRPQGARTPAVATRGLRSRVSRALERRVCCCGART